MYVKDYIIKQLSKETNPLMDNITNSLMNTEVYTGEDLLYCRNTLWINNVYKKTMCKLDSKNTSRLMAMDIPIVKPQIEDFLREYIIDLKIQHLDRLYKTKSRKIYLNIFILAPLTFLTVYTYNMKELYYFYGLCFIDFIWILLYIKAWKVLMKITKEIKRLEQY